MAFTNSRHTVKRFDSEIDSLIEQVLEMGRAAEQQVEQAVTAFRVGDIALAQAVVAGDDVLNRRDLDIDQACIRLLARRQPVSTDMRLVMSLHKAVADLERIGDEAKSIAKKVLAIQARGGELHHGIAHDMDHLAQVAVQRFVVARDALGQLNIEQAWRLVRQEEDPVEDAFQDSLRSLSVLSLEGGSMVATIIDVVLAFKALKRVADHADNLAEYVIYIVEGQDVRHSG
ncbi:MAG: phosphate signaling complex protein PhoU [Candidatus Competibacter sp.]|nr:phosphate signaling complex protein PhoU [Candidatus Competibacter sp.]MDG4583922.1 phosphate signaling complex protein PhoU [Candidatus Competibacter sp.]